MPDAESVCEFVIFVYILNILAVIYYCKCSRLHKYMSIVKSEAQFINPIYVQRDQDSRRMRLSL